jgi:hypothetical protein
MLLERTKLENPELGDKLLTSLLDGDGNLPGIGNLLGERQPIIHARMESIAILVYA